MKIKLDGIAILSHGQFGPYGPQSVYAMFIPWQADEGTRQDAITEAKRAKSRRRCKPLCCGRSTWLWTIRV